MNVANPTTFRSDALRLLSGSVMAQGLLILTMPILAWFFDPEAFGVAALFLSCTLIVGVISCGRYELAIVLPESDSDAVKLLLGCLATTGIVAALVFVFMSVFAPPEWNTYGDPPQDSWLWLLPVAILVHGWFLALSYWQTRQKQYTRQSVAKVSGSLAQVGVSLIGGILLAASGGVLIAAQVLGQLFSILVLAVPTLRSLSLSSSQAEQTSVVGLMWQYRKFPLLDSWSALVNSLSANLPVLVMTAFFPASIIGYFALGQRLLTVPMSLVGRSISQVFFQRAAVAQREGDLPVLVKSTVKNLSLLAGYPFLALMIVGPEVFEVIFGARWQPAGTYVQILAPWLLLNFLYSPISHLISVLEVQEIGLTLNGLLLALRFAALWVGGVQQDVFLMLVLYSASGTLLYGGFLVYLTTRAGVGLHDMVWTVAPSQVLGGLLLLPVLISKYLGAPTFLLLAMAAVLWLAYLGLHHKKYQPQWLSRWNTMQ